MQRILVLGGGFAGLWSALGAARKLDELGADPASTRVTLVDRNPYHAIRVRNYEEDLSGITLPFAEVLGPAGVDYVAGDVTAIDAASKSVTVATPVGARRLSYDRMVLALGSTLNRPPIPGLAEHGFDVDTYAAATRLDAHIANLAAGGPATVMVIGAGLTGIEVAAELPIKLRRLFGADRYRVILADSGPAMGSNMGEHARPVIMEAMNALGVETRAEVAVAGVDAGGVTLASGDVIAAQTVVWCAGMRASPLTALVPVERDRFGRLPVDEFMRVKGVPDLFAAGDCAWSLIDGEHASVMSCQHGRPMGRYAGHNVVADLFGQPMLPLNIDWYTTILDLGEWGALYTIGWDRQMHAKGPSAKTTKQTINRRRIYPPRGGDRAQILAAAAPDLSSPPV